MKEGAELFSRSITIENNRLKLFSALRGPGHQFRAFFADYRARTALDSSAYLGQMRMPKGMLPV
jgi:hypothetical protein